MTRFGVVLSSGGTRGVFAHTGFMRAINDLNIEISASAGCSAGAIVGGILASGTEIDNWIDATARIHTAQFWTPVSKWKFLYAVLIKKGLGLTGLSDCAAAISFLEDQLHVARFEDCKYPFSSLAVELDTVEKRVFREGSLAPAIMASAAMPGYYEPVEIDGRHYCDGAIYDLAPAEAICCRHDLDVLIIHHVQLQDFTHEGLLRTFREPWTIINLFQRLIFRRRPWYTTGAAINVCRCPCGCKATIVVVEPTLPELPWPMTADGGSVMATARAHAIDSLGPLLEQLRSDPRRLLKQPPSSPFPDNPHPPSEG